MPTSYRAAARSLALLAGAALPLASCKVGPDYRAPAPRQVPAWHALEQPGQTTPAPPLSLTSAPVATHADLARWWTVFGDQTLNSLIDRAVASSPDLKLAEARVREARALRRVSGAAELPTVDAAAAARRQRSSSTLSAGKAGSPSFSLGHDTSLFTAGLDASWELDVFGGIQRDIEAADASLAAAEESRRDTLVTLLAEVARNYAEARGFQRRLDVNERSVHNQEESVSLAQARLKAGVSSDLEVAQSQALLESRRATLPALRAGYQQAVHRLAVLLGQEPGSLAAELAAPAPVPPPPATVPVGLPSELLLRRPDVRRAERDLAAATARIGVAAADLYPRFSLTGSFALQSGKLATLGDMSSRAWSIGPAVRWNLFDRGRLRAQIDAAGAREAQALATYDKTVLASLEEVENRLVSFTQEQDRRAALANAADANARAVRLSTDLFRAGVRDFLNVLDSQRALYDAQDQLAQSDIAVTTNLIALYKSLGGGWEDLAPEGLAPTPPSAPEPRTPPVTPAPGTWPTPAPTLEATDKTASAEGA